MNILRKLWDFSGQNELAETLQSSAVNVWVYDVREDVFVWLDKKGRPERQSSLKQMIWKHGAVQDEKLYGILHRLITGESKRESTYVSLMPDKGTKVIHMLVNISVLKSDDRGPEQIIGIYRYIGDHETSATCTKAQEIKDIEAYIQNIDETLKVSHSRIVEYDPKRQRLNIFKEVGCVERSLSRELCLRMIDADERFGVAGYLNQMDMCKNHLFDMCVTLNSKNSEGIPTRFDLNFIPTYDGTTKKLTSYFGICRNVTSLKAAEENLRQEKERAYELERMQDIFIGKMDEEISEPLNAIINLSKQFEQAQSRSEGQQVVDEIQKNTMQLLKYADEALNLTKQESKEGGEGL